MNKSILFCYGIFLNDFRYLHLTNGKICYLLIVGNNEEEKMTRLLNAMEATKLLKISRSTLYRWTSKRKIPHIKAGGRVLFRPSDLDQWLKDKTVSPQG